MVPENIRIGTLRELGTFETLSIFLEGPQTYYHNEVSPSRKTEQSRVQSPSTSYHGKILGTGVI